MAPPHSHLLERATEVRHLRDAVDAALAGRGGVVAVEGPAGIGKTSLLEEAAAYAGQRGLRVLRARAGPLERDLGYAMVGQLYGRTLRDGSAAERARWLDGAAGLAVPALGGGGSAPDTTVMHGLYWLTANLADDVPLLLVADDAHWSDPPSLRWLLFLVRRVAELPVLLVYAARPDEGAAGDLPHALDPAAVPRPLRPDELGPDAGDELLRRHLEQLGHLGAVDDDLLVACRSAAGGNPFYLVEVAHAVAVDGQDAHDPAPEAVARSLGVRLAALGPDAREVCRAVAVLGSSATVRHASRLTGLSVERVQVAVDRLTRSDLLLRGTPLEFRHPVIGSTLYRSIPWGERSRVHLLAARMFRDEPEVAATHVLSVDPAADPEAVEILLAGADAALAHGSTDAAGSYLERALVEPPRPEVGPEVLHRLGVTRFRTARAGAADALLEAHAVTTPAHRAALAADLALALAAEGRSAEAVAYLDPVVHSLRRTQPDDALRLEALLAGVMQMDIATAVELPARLKPHRDLAGDTPGERLVLAMCASTFGLALQDSADQVADLALRALAGGQLLGDQQIEEQPAYMVVNALSWTGRFAETDAMQELMMQEATARGSAFAVAIIASSRSLTLTRAGRVRDARAHAEQALLSVHSGAVPAGLGPIVAAFLLPAFIENDDLAGAHRLLEETGATQQLPEQTVVDLLLHGRGCLKLETGDAEGAVTDLTELRERDRAWGMDNPAVWPTRGSTARALWAVDRREEATALAAEELSAARRWGAPHTVAASLVAVAGTAPELDVDVLREAADVAALGTSAFQLVTALTELGAALHRAGHDQDARTPLREALDLADRDGARRAARRARAALIAAGGRPRRQRLQGREALTPTELRVATLAAEGLSNRGIAQALFVTLRTVEGHLTRAYAKLGTDSRQGLSAALR